MGNTVKGCSNVSRAESHEKLSSLTSAKSSAFLNGETRMKMRD